MNDRKTLVVTVSTKSGEEFRMELEASDEFSKLPRKKYDSQMVLAELMRQNY